MRYLVTGASSAIGQEIISLIRHKQLGSICALRSDDKDYQDLMHLYTKIRVESPDVVIHVAQFGNIDKAEVIENQNMVLQLNIGTTEVISKACSEIGAHLIYLSSYQVFDGKKLASYQENDLVNPINNYGISKAKAEKIVLNHIYSTVVRSSWLFGYGKNFVNNIIEKSQIKDTVKIPDNEFGNPTFTKDLAQAIILLALNHKFGIYHITNRGKASYEELTQFIYNYYDIKTSIIGYDSSNAHLLIKNPENGSLDTTKFDQEFGTLRNWQEALSEYLNDKKYDNAVKRIGKQTKN